MFNGAHAKLPYVRASLIQCYSSMMLRYGSDTQKPNLIIQAPTTDVINYNLLPEVGGY